MPMVSAIFGTGGLADNEKTRQLEKRVSGTAVSQLSFLQISNQFQVVMILYMHFGHGNNIS